MEQTTKIKGCRRCNCPVVRLERICQNCKSDLIGHFEVSQDWNIAFEMEKAQNFASRNKKLSFDEAG